MGDAPADVPSSPTAAERAEEETGGMYMGASSGLTSPSTVLIEFVTGTSLRELVHRFRFKTLMLLKLLILQRRVSSLILRLFVVLTFSLQVMFYAAHTPVEQLCTFQYSLVTLIPGLSLRSFPSFQY